jgi:hypothetical protein
MNEAGGRISGKGGAAEPLGISPSTLASRMKALNLDGREPLIVGNSKRRLLAGD